MTYSKHLRKAAKIADERGKQYGDVVKCFEDTKKILETTFGIRLAETEICKVMIAMKLARELHQPKKDNKTDVINYFAILTELIDET